MNAPLHPPTTYEPEPRPAKVPTVFTFIRPAPIETVERSRYLFTPHMMSASPREGAQHMRHEQRKA